MRAELLLFPLLLSCVREVPPLHVFTAASMEEPITDLAGKDAVINAGASSTLARQLDRGAKVDLFVSADRDWADHVAARHEIVEMKVIARNRLVLIAPSNSTRSADELFRGRIAIADPTHVPAGKYAQAALEKLGQRPESIASTGDVRAALAMVERGEADGGVVYATDARLSDRVRVVKELESPLPIEYHAVLLDPRARTLFDRLSGDDGARVLEKYGFTRP